MEITRSTAHVTWTVLAVTGRLDHEAAGAFDEACREALAPPTRDLALDLSEVTFLASACLRAILVTAREIGPLNVRLAIVGARAPVREVLELSGMGRFLPQVATLDALR